MLVIGIGNDLRGDDAAGLLVARRLREARPDLDTRESSADPMTLMEAWEGEEDVLLVDAVESGGVPGEIHRMNAREKEMPADFFHCSTHSIGVAEAVEFARSLNRMPERLTVFGIEGRHFQAGQEISPPVLDAVEKLTQTILEENP